MGNSALKADYYRSKAVWYLEKWLGTPYTYGGDDFRSLDCSGLIIEILKGAGKICGNEDYSADSLYQKYQGKRIQGPPYAGCLIFWINQAGKAVHVAMMADDYFIIHAAGGGPTTKTIEDAIRDNAYVMMRELREVAAFRKKHYSQDFVAVDPFKE